VSEERFDIRRFVCPKLVQSGRHLSSTSDLNRGHGFCPECGCFAVWAEFVDVGVGFQQVTPEECSNCCWSAQYGADDRDDGFQAFLDGQPGLTPECTTSPTATTPPSSSAAAVDERSG
jgi:hypothetical protein